MANDLVTTTHKTLYFSEEAPENPPFYAGDQEPNLDLDITRRLFAKKMKIEVEKALGVYGLMGRELLTIGGVIYSVPCPDWVHDGRDILTGYSRATL